LKNALTSQAYLMWLLGQRSPKSLISEDQSSAFNYQYVKVLTGDYVPDSVMGKLGTKFRPGTTQFGAQKRELAFFDLETYKMSMLVPEIRLYKIVGDSLIPFYFPITSDFDPLENGSSELTGYVGGNSTIDNFTVVFEGQDFFTGTRYLRCNLTIKVDSLANIFLKKPGYSRLADLFTFATETDSLGTSGGGKSAGSGQLRKQNEIAIILGYSFMDNDGTIFTEKEREEIERNTISLRMYVGDHTINVEQDGTASIDIEYSAFIDSSRFEHASVVESPGDIVRRAKIRSFASKKKINKVNSTKNKNDQENSLEAQKTRYKVVTETQAQLRRVTEILEERSRLFSIDVEPGLLFLYTNPVHLQDQVDIESEVDASMAVTSAKDAVPSEDMVSASDGKTESNKLLEKLQSSVRTFHFFTFGDMIEAFFLKQRETFERALLEATSQPDNDETVKEIQRDIDNLNKMTVALADVHLSYDDGKIVRVNLADLPVSAEIYQQFIFNEVVNMADKTYTIKKFLEDCYKVILDKIFSSFQHAAPNVLKNTNATFSAVTYSGPKAARTLEVLSKNQVAPDQIPGPLDGGLAVSIPDNKFEVDESNTEKEYFVIYPQPNTIIPSDKKNGDKKEDVANGIYHFHLGKDRGIIKNISFSKFAVEYKRESLMVNQIGLYDELKQPYHASITMFGNNIFFPGSQIYIDPFSVGFGDPRDEKSPAANLGLGGYYLVLKVKTMFSNLGTMVTNLECSFASPTKEGSAKLPTAADVQLRNRRVNELESKYSEKSDDQSPIPETRAQAPSRVLSRPTGIVDRSEESDKRYSEMLEEQRARRERDLEAFNSDPGGNSNGGT
jgi:hypothetical protein